MKFYARSSALWKIRDGPLFVEQILADRAAHTPTPVVNYSRAAFFRL